MQTEDQTDSRQLLPLKELICLLLLKKVESKKSNSYLQRLTECWWESNIWKWQRKTLALSASSVLAEKGWKYLRYGLGEDVTWLVRPELCSPGFKVSAAHGEMLSGEIRVEGSIRPLLGSFEPVKGALQIILKQGTCSCCSSFYPCWSPPVSLWQSQEFGEFMQFPSRLTAV